MRSARHLGLTFPWIRIHDSQLPNPPQYRLRYAISRLLSSLLNLHQLVRISQWHKRKGGYLAPSMGSYLASTYSGCETEA